MVCCCFEFRVHNDCLKWRFACCCYYRRFVVFHIFLLFFFLSVFYGYVSVFLSRSNSNRLRMRQNNWEAISVYDAIARLSICGAVIYHQRHLLVADSMIFLEWQIRKNCGCCCRQRLLSLSLSIHHAHRTRWTRFYRLFTRFYWSWLFSYCSFIFWSDKQSPMRRKH